MAVKKLGYLCFNFLLWSCPDWGSQVISWASHLAGSNEGLCTGIQAGCFLWYRKLCWAQTKHNNISIYYDINSINSNYATSFEWWTLYLIIYSCYFLQLFYAIDKMRKLRAREVSGLVQGHTVSKSKSRQSGPRSPYSYAPGFPGLQFLGRQWCFILSSLFSWIR